ncbi:hypothetical protein Y032_0183g928 [Ancylostoma ceylanicum]|uniref:Uncharacterized protein n=1 Tax=Ancylostoma ceylanicum TaxID=53326 RepID=A0A016SSK1_9BILA|nr:hypothetical protein Y032_0183g928 [Ancylostoma ceylanicum]
MTTAEVMELLREDHDIYDNVEQSLRHLMVEEKPDASLPVLPQSSSDETRSSTVSAVATGSSQYMPSFSEEYLEAGTSLNDREESEVEVDEVAG